MKLEAYLCRIGVEPGAPPLKADLACLTRIMRAQSEAIAFENIDVVCGRTISMDRLNVERKLVQSQRGGYCWEQNTLLQMALEEIGFDVVPLMCRVRWRKPDDALGPNTPFTHMALKVSMANGSLFLADVGFAGTNSIAPVALGDSEPQLLPEGQFRVIDSRHTDFSVLQLLIKGEWNSLYEWRSERAPLVDMESANWFSCTYPRARFTTQFFVCRTIGDERHHILDAEYVVRRGHGIESRVDKFGIQSRQQLLEVLRNTFGIELDTDTAQMDALYRYLVPKA